jgi:hypothetical protein
MRGIADFRLAIADGHWKELPDHFFNRPAAAGHAIIFPRFPVTISPVMESIKEK